MARSLTTFPFETLSGRVGNAVWANYPDGPRVRQYVRPRSPQTPLQVEAQARTTRVSRTWALLDDDRFARWQAYASNPTFSRSGKRPKGSGPGRAYSLFSGLATQRVRIDPGVDLLTFDPPTRAFLGDLIEISATGRATGIEFGASGANAAGVVTELRIQKLRHANCLPSPDKYRFAAFHAFAAGEATEVPVAPGAYACAYMFYDAQTGQTRGLVEIGVARVG